MHGRFIGAEDYEKSRCTEEQMVKILREAGLCAKKHGVSDVTPYAWRSGSDNLSRRM